MAITVKRPQPNARIGSNHTAFGTAPNPARVRGLAVAQNGTIILGEPLPPIRKSWAVQFLNLPSGRVTLCFFDVKNLLLSLVSVNVQVTLSYASYAALNITWPRGGDTVDPQFWAERNTTTGANLNFARMENQNDATHFYDATAIMQPVGTDYWSAGFDISPTVMNDYRLRVGDTSGATDSEEPITVQTGAARIKAGAKKAAKGKAKKVASKK